MNVLKLLGVFSFAALLGLASSAQAGQEGGSRCHSKSSVSASVHSPGVSRSARGGNADANYGGGSAAMSPNKSGNGKDR